MRRWVAGRQGGRARPEDRRVEQVGAPVTAADHQRAQVARQVVDQPGRLGDAVPGAHQEELDPRDAPHRSFFPEAAVELVGLRKQVAVKDVDVVEGSAGHNGAPEVNWAPVWRVAELRRAGDKGVTKLVELTWQRLRPVPAVGGGSEPTVGSRFGDTGGEALASERRYRPVRA
jgi:hypothetical protein